MRAAVYTRVSSDPRGAGRSVAEQEQECRAVAEREGWSIEAVLCDNDRSASRYARKTRPAFAELERLIDARRVDVVMTWEASRFQRDLEVYVRLRELCRARGVLWSYSGRVFDLTRTDDRLMTGLDALLAERESDVTRERVLRSVRANAASGRPHGKILYGYRREYDHTTGALLAQVVDEPKAKVIREVARRVRARESLYAIARDLDSRGIPAPRGGRWDATVIRRMVLNPGYLAQRVHRGAVVGPAAWPAILDEATAAECRAILTDPTRNNVADHSVKHLLSGIAVCGICGAAMIRGRQRTYYAYVCGGKYCTARHQDRVDELVTAVVLERLSRADAVDLLHAREQPDTRAALDEAAEKRARLAAFYDAAAAGELTPAALARIEATLLPQIAAAEARARPAENVPDGMKRLVEARDIESAWRRLSVPQRREVVRTLLDVVIHPVGRGKRIFDPKCVEIRWKT
jgi:site-specific DNA recombinase